MNDQDQRISRPLRRLLQDWLFALLKLAITADPADRLPVLELAAEMDDLSVQQGDRSFSYFVRTSHELCDAMARNTTERSVITLRRHASRIENPKLKSAFLIAVGLEEKSNARARRPVDRRAKSANLWKGLRS